nr:cache domain-containing protein [Flexivirga meconopsidis]
MVACSQEVDRFLGELLVDVRAIGAAARAAFGDSAPTAGRLTSAVEPGVNELMDRRDDLQGCGFVVAPGIFADRELFLAWWQGRPRAFLGEARSVTGEALDYTRQAWYRAPATTGAEQVTGPYVDYVCTDEYVVTVTAPVADDSGRLLGVAGADLLAATVEDWALPLLRTVGGRATLIGTTGRAVVSLDPAVRLGRAVAQSAIRERVVCRVAPMTVAQL